MPEAEPREKINDKKFASLPLLFHYKNTFSHIYTGKNENYFLRTLIKDSIMKILNDTDTMV